MIPDWIAVALIYLLLGLLVIALVEGAFLFLVALVDIIRMR